jgi:hypothetical protein
MIPFFLRSAIHAGAVAMLAAASGFAFVLASSFAPAMQGWIQVDERNFSNELVCEIRSGQAAPGC